MPLRRLERESRKALSSLGLERAELSLVFASARHVRRLNLQYRGIDSTTDVLSFPLHEFMGRPAVYRSAAKDARAQPGMGLLLGDVVIDPELALTQAGELGHSPGDELMRLVVHGLLHLLGYDHERGANERRRMRRAELRLFEALGLRLLT